MSLICRSERKQNIGLQQDILALIMICQRKNVASSQLDVVEVNESNAADVTTAASNLESSPSCLIKSV